MRHAQGFVLLKENRFDPARFLHTLQHEWGISPDEGEDITNEDGILNFNVNGLLCALSLMPAPFPDGEAEQNAAFNYYWPEAVEETSKHQAHILLVVMPLGETDATPIDVMALYSKLACTALADENSIGIYTSGTVFAPDFYRDVCSSLHEGELPIPAWIFIGLYGSEAGSSAYTIGLEQFNKMELEILNSEHESADLHAFLCSICDYLISQNVTLQDGETIGFSAEEKLIIARSPAVAGVAEETLKIDY